MSTAELLTAFEETTVESLESEVAVRQELTRKHVAKLEAEISILNRLIDIKRVVAIEHAPPAKNEPHAVVEVAAYEAPQVKAVSKRTSAKVSLSGSITDQVMAYLDAAGRSASGLLARNLMLDKDAVLDVLEANPTLFVIDGDGFWNLRSKVAAMQEAAGRL